MTLLQATKRADLLDLPPGTLDPVERDFVRKLRVSEPLKYGDDWSAEWLDTLHWEYCAKKNPVALMRRRERTLRSKGLLVH